MSNRRQLTGLLFVSPWLLGCLLLLAYPFLASLVWSFCRYDLLATPQFIGDENYRRLAEELLTGGRLARAVWNTAYFGCVSVPLSIALGIGLALLLAQPARGQTWARALIFLPSVVPVVSAAVLWMWLLDPAGGVVNQLLSVVGVGPQGWFRGVAEAAWIPGWFQGRGGFGSKDGLVLMSLWGVGNFMVIYLAALDDIPRPLYEAAELDGAGPWRRFWHVTLPLLSPVIFFNLVMGLIQSVQAFTQVYLVSEGTGEPAGSSLVLSLHLFLAAFQDLDVGYASAMAWCLFVVLALATGLLFASSRHWVHSPGGPG